MTNPQDSKWRSRFRALPAELTLCDLLYGHPDPEVSLEIGQLCSRAVGAILREEERDPEDGVTSAEIYAVVLGREITPEERAQIRAYEEDWTH